MNLLSRGSVRKEWESDFPRNGDSLSSVRGTLMARFKPGASTAAVISKTANPH